MNLEWLHTIAWSALQKRLRDLRLRRVSEVRLPRSERRQSAETRSRSLELLPPIYIAGSDIYSGKRTISE